MTLVNLDIFRQSRFSHGQSFGDVGTYEYLEGVAHFAVDPVSRTNSPITDIELAPRDAEGKVTFSSDFAMLQPVDPAQGNRSLLFDVVNRGNKTALSNFNSAPRAVDPLASLDPGNGHLMRRGYTVVWCGWQADVPPTPGLVGMQAPEALGPDGPLEGDIMLWFQVNEPTQVQTLSHSDHAPHPPVDPDDSAAFMVVRDHPNAPYERVPRESWSFVRVEDEEVEPEPSHVHLASGFEPGRIYQLVYRTHGSKVVGLGFAAVRDVVSFLKHGTEEDGNPCAGLIDHGYAFGRSQSGRFLRQLLHLGLNEDEDGRMALDGVMPIVAGGMRGEFNLRFGQPSKDICYVIPELFPFTDKPQTDPVTGGRGSILARLEDRGVVPKTMLINTSSEYWRGDAALIHTDLESMADTPESEHVRRYHFAGTQHSIGVFPPEEARPTDGMRGHLPYNSVDYSPLLRAALRNLDGWVASGDLPPPSRHPTVADGTAVESHAVLPRFRDLPGVRVPPRTTRAMRLDYGPEADLGRTTTLPPVDGEEYPALVSNVDDDRNEVAGIRLPDLTVPVATYTGWNLRHPQFGNPDLFIGVTGGLAGWTLPFPATRAESKRIRDPRPSIEERYASQDDYVAQVRDAAEALVEQGYMLEEDVDDVVEQAVERYRSFVNERS